MENTCRDIIIYTGEREVLPIVMAAPGHRENAIEVENAPDLHQVHQQFGPIGNLTPRRSRHTRRPDSTTPSSSALAPKKKKGSGSFPISFDYDLKDNAPLSQFIPQFGRTSRSATTPTSSTILSVETTVPPTAMETERSSPSPNFDPVAAHTSSPPRKPTLGGNDSSSDNADFVPNTSASASASKSKSATASDAMPNPAPSVRSPPPARSPPSTHSTPSTRRGKPHSTQFAVKVY